MERTEKLASSLRDNLPWRKRIPYSDLRGIDTKQSDAKMVRVIEASGEKRKLRTLSINYLTYFVHYPSTALTLLENKAPISFEETGYTQEEIKDAGIGIETIAGEEVPLISNDAMEMVTEAVAVLVNRDVEDTRRYYCSPYHRLIRLNPEHFRVQTFKLDREDTSGTFWFGNRDMTMIQEPDKANSATDW